MGQVIEQGATRRFRPSDFSGGGRSPNLDAGSPNPWKHNPPDYRPARTPRRRGRPAKIFQPKFRPAFGRKLRVMPKQLPLGRLIPLGLLPFLIDGDIIPLPSPWVNPFGKPTLGGSWKLCKDCPVGEINWMHGDTSCGTCAGWVWSCIGGQACSGCSTVGKAVPNDASVVTYPSTWKRIMFSERTVASSVRYRWVRGYRQTCGSPAPPKPVAMRPRYNARPPLNPNIARGVPSIPPIVFSPQTDPENGLAPGLDPAAEPQPGLSPWGKTWTDAGVIDTPPGFRVPPGEGEVERKTTSRSKQALIAIFKALDVLSEYGELVAVFYDAIDKTARRDYEKKYLGGHWVKWQGKWHWWLDPKLSPKYRGFIDSAGQYGISGTDWKAPAIAALWEHIDTDKAFRGILANVSEDFLIGHLNRTVGDVYKGPKSGLPFLGDVSQAISREMKNLAGILE